MTCFGMDEPSHERSFATAGPASGPQGGARRRGRRRPHALEAVMSTTGHAHRPLQVVTDAFVLPGAPVARAIRAYHVRRSRLGASRGWTQTASRRGPVEGCALAFRHKAYLEQARP